MNQDIQINDINNSTDDNIILQYIKDFKAIKCLYCFQDNPKFLAQCKECGFYFCNNIHRKTSHIILHLKQCKHKKVSLVPFTDELACEKWNIGSNFEYYIHEYFRRRLNKRIYTWYIDGDFLLLKFMYHRGAFRKDINEKCLLCETEDNGIEHVINNCKKLEKERNELITELIN